MKTLLTYDHETKGTHIYKNSTVGAPISSVYISKAAFKGDPPKTITLDIKEL